MCLYLRPIDKQKTAEIDLHFYKVLVASTMSSIGLTTPYYQMSVSLNQTYYAHTNKPQDEDNYVIPIHDEERESVKCVQTNLLYARGLGHSFKVVKERQRTVDGGAFHLFRYYDDAKAFVDDVKHTSLGLLLIFDAIVPKGAKYIEGYMPSQNPFNQNRTYECVATNKVIYKKLF